MLSPFSTVYLSISEKRIRETLAGGRLRNWFVVLL